MFFSTDKDNLPRIGELICIRGSDKHDLPYRVTDRMIEKESGQVYVDLIDIATGQKMPRCKVEPFSFWPAQGDTVLIIMGPYLDWLAEQIGVAKKSGKRNRIKQIENRFRACEAASKTTDQLCQEHILELVEGEIGAVKRKGGDLFKCPLRCLAVLKKADRRSDSRFDQLERAKQMNLLEEAA
ncbi:hypothetical protein D0962_34385 [Leptolyngbyaceae cyanobacterium CCMR0082]|uniref:Uncharacterized protein n=1 Tax=Adonisia turfae CCMR0082 TaxID=2304604 RepID=A0A6M0SGS7_9CYAN|nr:hypothetical protein [Adonisia turfae]NEZ67788.1 hypothetical protein [Adonisia turfae CCMR0082]